MAAPAKKNGPVPLGLRLKAWWEGYDADELARQLLKAQEKAAPKSKREPALPEKPKEPLVISPSIAFDMPFDPWDKDRVSVAQLIWGAGYCGPGGPDHVIAMSKLLALSPEMSMMHLGAGLGGPARTLAHEFGVWVTGYEESQILVDHGNELSTMAGMAKKAEMSMLDMAADAPFGRKFDRALASNFFIYHEGKEDAVKKISAILKPDALFLITDLFLADDALVATDGYRDWRASEPRRPTPCERRELTQLLEQSELTVRVDDDLTAEYIDLVTKAWSGADRVVADVISDSSTSHLAQVVLKEAEVWSRRLAMLKSGRLSFRRMLASKREKRISTMSNW